MLYTPRSSAMVWALLPKSSYLAEEMTMVLTQAQKIHFEQQEDNASYREIATVPFLRLRAPAYSYD